MKRNIHLVFRDQNFIKVTSEDITRILESTEDLVILNRGSESMKWDGCIINKKHIAYSVPSEEVETCT